MTAMQYEIDLPGDYDMAIIRQRVSKNGSKTDGFFDLGMKAYLVAEKAKYGNAVNRYAPFYLWKGTEGINRFLLGGPFDNILNSFGRPSVFNSPVLHCKVLKNTEVPQFAMTQTEAMPYGLDFKTFCAKEKETFLHCESDPTLTGYALAYDPCRWELKRFYMSMDLDKLKRIADFGNLIYDVLHVS